MVSTMQSKVKQLLRGVIAAAFWLALWEGLARWLDLPFALPTIPDTAAALSRLVVTRAFWLTVGSSLLRILLGLLLGTGIGVLLAAVSVLSGTVKAIVSPAMTVIRATPVASFIMILWILVGRDAVPQAIAVLMVAPVIWQGLCDGYDRLDPAMDEVLTVFRSSFGRRLRLLILPGLKAPFLTGLANAAGLAWKAGIAAEIIAYTSHSIGRQIADARNLFNGP